MMKQQTQQVRNINPQNSDLSRDNNLGRTELKQLEAINSPNEQSEEIKHLVVYDIAAKDGVTAADTKKSVSILPYDDKDEVITSNPFQAAISLWQNYMSAWFRVWNVFPTTITEVGFFRLSLFIQREGVSRP